MKIFDKYELKKFLRSEGCISTCSLKSPTCRALSFIRAERFKSDLYDIDEYIYVLVDNSLELDIDLISKKIILIYTNEDVSYLFTKFHNEIYKNILPKDDIIGTNCKIHKSVQIGMEGQRIIYGPNSDKIRLKHMGNVVIGDNVQIDAFTSVHRAGFDSTIIGDDSTISTHVNIGHNCIIGKNVFIGPGAKIAGSAVIGNNCTLWQGVLIRNGISICKDTIIGMGSVVTKDITKPGLYFGNPCRLKKELVKND